MHTIFAAAGTFDSVSVKELFLAIAIILAVARVLGEMARALGQPPIVGEIFAGILLGKTILGRVSPDLYNGLFGSELGTSADIGFQAMLTVSAAMLLLVAGLEVDLKAITRERKATASVAFTSMLIPFALGAGFAWFAPGLLGEAGPANPLVFALFIGVALSITALPVIAKILMDLGLQRSDLGVVVLAAAVANDLIGWIGFASVLALAGAGGDTSLWMTIGLTIGFAILCLTVFRWLATPFLTWVQANGGWPTGVLGAVFVCAFFAAAFTEWIGVHAIFGAFLAGVLFADTGRLRVRTLQSVEDLTGAIFAPLFFASIALNVDFLGNFDLVSVLVVLVIAIAGKLFGGWFGARMVGMGPRESWAVGAGMTARGAMEIILAELALEAGIIGDELFVAIVFMSLITSILAGPAIERILARPSGHTLSSLLKSGHIIYDLKANTVGQAIRELNTVAGLSTGLGEKVVRRELQSPTGLPGGWALPHVRCDKTKSPVMALGFCRSGIDFLAPDDQQTRVIVYLISPEGSPDLHLQLLASCARLFGDEDFIEELIAAPSKSAVRAAIRLAESEDSGHH